MRQGDLFEPSLTYDRTSGSVHTDTSKAQTAKKDAGGATGKRQAFTLKYAQRAGASGITVVDLREHPGFIGHHGEASSSLTNLHKDDRIVRLSECRNQSHVYVLPEFVNGREVLPFRSQRSFLPIDNLGARRAAVDYIRAHQGSDDPGERALALHLRASLEVLR